MADELISRQAALKEQYIGFDRVKDTEWQEGYWDGVDCVCDTIKKLPAVDAVEVVRCKDCKHKITTVFSTKYGRFAVCEICKGIRHGLDDFCSYGERREENEP